MGATQIIHINATLPRLFYPDQKWAMTSGPSFHGKTQTIERAKEYPLASLWRAVRSTNVALIPGSAASDFLVQGSLFLWIGGMTIAH